MRSKESVDSRPKRKGQQQIQNRDLRRASAQEAGAAGQAFEVQSGQCGTKVSKGFNEGAVVKGFGVF